MTFESSVKNVVSLANDIVYKLQLHGHTGAAADLDNLLTELLLDDEERQRVILQDINDRCDIRWLGDLYLPGISLNDWWNRLEKLKTSTKQALKAK